jgi:hypothetical protein
MLKPGCLNDSETKQKTEHEMCVVENVVLNALITHEDRDFVTEAGYKVEDIERGVSSCNPDVFLCF